MDDDRQPIVWQEARLRVARPAPGLLSAVLLLLALVFGAAAIAMMTAHSTLPGLLVFGPIAALFAWSSVRSRHWFLDSKKVTLQGVVRVDEQGITYAGGNFTPRERLAHGLVSGTGVRFVEKDGAWLEIDGPQSGARAMLDRLGLGVRDRAASIVVNRTARATALGIVPFFTMLSMLRFVGAGPVYFSVAAALVVLVNLANMFRTLRRPSAVSVGLDVVTIRRPIGGIRSIALGRITEASADLAGAHLTLDDGERVSILCDKATDAELAAERVREAKEAAARAEAPSITALLGREGRGIAEWMADLRALLADGGAEDYRAAVDRPALLATLEDPTTRAEARVGAAIALRERLDDEGRAKLRVAIDTAADARLRLALEAVAEGDDEQLERAVGQLEA